MSFNSTEYGILLFLTLSFSWFSKGYVTSLIVLAASMIFYGWLNPFYLWHLTGIVTLSFVGGILLEKFKNRWLLTLFIISNLLLLLYYKYYSVFTHYLSFIIEQDLFTPPKELPIGISFFTFQGIGYLVDVYRKEIKAERSWFNFYLFLSFFPQLVAGPIERAHHLIPQVKRLSNGWKDYIKLEKGLFLILKGLVLKVVFADNFAYIVNLVHNNSDIQNDLNLFYSIYLFTFQIYCDFFGYTMIALGSALLFGVDLTNNFQHPYFAVNIQDFWRRWHVSLSRWFRDYVYIPLGGNRVSTPRFIFNLFATMFLTGVWHGATINFLLWAMIHTFALLFHRFYNYITKKIPTIYNLRNTQMGYIGGWFLTFHFVALAWVPFRATSYDFTLQIWRAFYNVVVNALFMTKPSLPYLTLTFKLTLAFMIYELIDKAWGLENLYEKFNLLFKIVIITLMLLSLYLGPADAIDFIYFQF